MSRPTYNHTRADGPYDPCPICAELQSPTERLALALAKGDDIEDKLLERIEDLKASFLAQERTIEIYRRALCKVYEDLDLASAQLTDVQEEALAWPSKGLSLIEHVLAGTYREDTRIPSRPACGWVRVADVERTMRPLLAECSMSDDTVLQPFAADARAFLDVLKGVRP